MPLACFHVLCHLLVFRMKFRGHLNTLRFHSFQIEILRCVCVWWLCSKGVPFTDAELHAMKAFIQKQVDKIDEALEKNRQFLKNRQQKRSQFLKNRQHEGPEDDNWDLEQANVLADVLAIARQERVAIAKEDKEAKKKLLKDMKDLKDFYAGNLFAEKAAAEEPEEEPKAAAAGGGSCKSSCWKAKGSSCSCKRRIQQQQRMSLNSSQKRSKALSQLLED